MARQGRLFAMACLVLAMALWGSSFIALKFAFAELPPMWVIFGRMALGSLVFLLAWRWRGRLDYRPGDWRYLLALADCPAGAAESGLPLPDLGQLGALSG